MTAVFLTLDLTGITGEKALFLERWTIFRINDVQCSGDTETSRTSLACETTTGYVDLDIELVGQIEQDEGLAKHHPEGLTAKILLMSLAVDRDRTRPGL